ncbi:MAG: reverse transcriptase domain-containing protein [Steroidobacteraceae bacterium]
MDTSRTEGWGGGHRPRECGAIRTSPELLSGRIGVNTAGRQPSFAACEACVHTQRQGAAPARYTAVKDRVLQAALKLVIGSIFEHEFEPRRFGFRQGLGCKDALREVDRYLKSGCFWVVDADLQSYFDMIPHTPLLAKVGLRIADGRVLELVQQFLKQDIMEDMTRSGRPFKPLIYRGERPHR